LDLALTLTLQAIRRQLAAMPCELYLVRLIHNLTKRPIPGERCGLPLNWQTSQPSAFCGCVTAKEATCTSTHPYAQGRNAGHILIDLGDVGPVVLWAMRANGHEPCAVVQTSPLAIGSRGGMSALLHGTLPSLPPLVGTWRTSMAATTPVPTGVIWADSPASPICSDKGTWTRSQLKIPAYIRIG
jgi:hypothetical protein